MKNMMDFAIVKAQGKKLQFISCIAVVFALELFFKKSYHYV